MYTLYFDGCSKGNPGPSGTGYVIIYDDDDDKELYFGMEFLGHATNNVAEYKALIFGLKDAQKNNITQLVVKGDSKLIIKQVSLQWKCKAEHLKPLLKECLQLVKQIGKVTFEWIPRSENKRADNLCNLALL
uniref:Ribonuclease H n=1 Tax=Pithovirus LCPAC406 TaxID=2506599 RepID=A0A481ZGX4_9VIRU|nr:MAG: ribonuclease H [Pithovirus LCPAC406]